MRPHLLRSDIEKPNKNAIKLRTPAPEDGSQIWQLIRECEPLDRNSMYCNILQCDHFADTCVVAEMDGEIVGWVSGYIVPSDPDTLFVWQVAVSDRARGMGVAKTMLNELVTRECCADVSVLKTTITRDNEASWALFNAFADQKNAPLAHDAYYVRDDHFDGRHATEHMVTIAPFGERKSAAA